MKIENKKINGYDVYYYETPKYSTINLKFIFELPYTKENIFKYDLLEEYMIHSSAKYKTRKDISDKRSELYSIQFGVNNYNVGEKMFTEVMVNIFDPELVGEDYLKEALEFVHDILFSPNFEGGALDKDEKERSIEYLRMRIQDGLMDFYQRSDKDLYRKLYKGTYLLIDDIKSIDEYDDLIASFTDADLIEAHKDLIDNRLVCLVVQGNLKSTFFDMLEQTFFFKNVASIDCDYKDRLTIPEDVDEFIHAVDEDYEESVIEAVYEVPVTDLKSRLVYGTISSMFGSSGLLLHKMLREELKIVYYAQSEFSRKRGTITFIAHIDRTNADTAIEGFTKVIEKLKDPVLIEDLLAKVKKGRELFVYTFDENKWNPFYEMRDVVLNFDESLETRMRVASSITVEDVLQGLDAMKRRVIHFYEGGKK